MVLLRAFASVWDFVNFVFGTNIPSIPPQTYGTFMAIAFGVGLWIANKEFKRRTNLGIFRIDEQDVVIGEKIDWLSVVFNALFGGFVLMKILGIATEFDIFQMNPQKYILSLMGSRVGFFIGAILAGGYIYYEQKKALLPTPKKGIKKIKLEDRLFELLTIALVGGVVGSKIFDAIENPASMEQLINDPLVSLTSGLSILGGVWMVALLFILYAYFNKIKLLPFLDTLALPFFMAYAVGRLGCLFSGDGCWGISNVGYTKPSFIPDFLWGSKFAHNVNNDGIPLNSCNEPYCYVLEEPHFPTPLYEFLLVTGLFLILWKLRERFTWNFGMITGLFLIANGIERFLIEFIRVNDKYNYFGFNLSQSQYMALIMILIGVVLTVYAKRNKQNPSIG